MVWSAGSFLRPTIKAPSIITLILKDIEQEI
jgi:hypothetical protein